MVLIILLLAVLAFHLLMFSSVLWRCRRALSVLNASLVLSALCITVFFSDYLNVPIIALIVAIGLFMMLNLARIAKARMHPDYLRSVTFRTSIALDVLLIATFAVSFMLQDTDTMQFVQGLAGIQVIVLGGILITTIVSIQKSKHSSRLEHYADREFPSVSVAIPARNETEDLEVCIRSLLANDYPKLEILVLDDCSQDKNSDIIKKFAHDGVRFIKGSAPDPKWLPKNHAYQRLLDEASGAYILFCGVDTRFGSHAIHALVEYAVSDRQDMVSVLPKRLTNNTAAAFIQPMRYWWELSIPRWLTKRPPVLSTCWLIRKERLLNQGGFKAVARTILPERYFAREIARTQQYRFLRANEELDVQTSKTLKDQKETAVRVRYPQLHKRPELVLLLSLFEGAFLLGPFVLFVLAITNESTALVLLTTTSMSLVVVSHLIIVTVSNPSNTPVALLNFPLVVLTELILGYESMFRYEFGTVEWKERNVCIPVMHVVPSLPSLKDKS